MDAWGCNPLAYDGNSIYGICLPWGQMSFGGQQS